MFHDFMRRIFPSPCPLVGLLALWLSVGPARAADPAVDMWQMLKTNYDNYTSHLKPLPEHRMSQIMQIRADGRYLVLRTPLNDNGVEQQMRVVADGIHGTGAISFRRDDHADGLAEPLGFSIAFADFPASLKTTNVSVTLDATTHQLAFSNSVQVTNGPIYQVFFTQHKPMISGGGGSVILSVTQTRALGTAPDQLNLEAPDFFSFIREYPGQTEQYLRPMFRELGQEAVFAPDTMVAWQVFGDLWKPEPLFAREVQALLPGLDAADYHDRDAAQLRLEHLGRDGAGVLLHIDRNHLTPEQNARVDCALGSYSRLTIKEAARLGADPGFLLDCLYSDSLDLRTAAYNRLRTMLGPGWQFDVNADADTRAAGVRALRAQLVPAKHSDPP